MSQGGPGVSTAWIEFRHRCDFRSFSTLCPAFIPSLRADYHTQLSTVQSVVVMIVLHGACMQRQPSHSQGASHRRLLLLLLLKTIDEEHAVRGGGEWEAISNKFRVLIRARACTHLVSKNLSTQLLKHCSSFLLKLEEMPPVMHLSKQRSVNVWMEDETRALACSASRNCLSSAWSACESDMVCLCVCVVVCLWFGGMSIEGRCLSFLVVVVARRVRLVL